MISALALAAVLSRRRCEMAKGKLEKTNLVQDHAHEMAIFHAMAESAVDGMALTTLEGVITYANPASHVLFGYDAESREMVSLPLSRFFSESGLKVLVEEAIPQSLDGANWQGEVHGIQKDGTQFDVLTTIFAIHDERGDPIALTAVLRDITERRQVGEALRASEERFSLAVRGSNDGIWDWDIQNDSLYWSPRLKELLGYADDELDVDFEVFDAHLHPDDKEHTQAAIEAHLKDGGLYSVEQRLRTKSGEYRWFRARGQALWDEAGNPVRMVGSLADITEHKQAEANLERRAVQLQAAAEVSRTTTSVLDPDELLRKVVDLVRERFDLYYAGLFLVDEAGEGIGEPGRWAVLRAGTGEAGRKMLKARHKLAVGGESMIGWCIANARARIALDVGEEAVRFDNPLLPETRSEMALPLVSRGQVIGAMTIQSTQSAAFSQEDITVLQTMADQLANAIENARLFEEALAHTREMTALAETGRKLASTLELDAVLDSIMDACLGFFQVQQACFIMMDEDGYLRMRRHRGLSEEFVRSIVGRLGEGFFGKVYQSGEAILIRDARKQLDPVTAEAVLSEGVTSFVHVPVKVKGETVAVMNLTSLQEERRFSERDLERLSAFTDQAAVAIENARLFEETQRRAIQLRIVNEVGRTLTSILDVDTLLGQVVRLIRDTFGYYQVNLGLVEGDALVPKAWIGALSTFPTEVARLDLDAESIVTKVVNSGTPLLVPDVRREPLYLPLPGLEEVRSELAVPLKSKGQVIGMLDVESDRLAAFDERDLTVLEALAGQIAVAIENARLFREAQSRLQEQTMLFTVSQRLAGASLEFKEVAEVIVRQFVEVMGVLECSLSLLDPDEGTLEVIVDLYVDEGRKKIHQEEVEEVYRLEDYPATARVIETLQPLVVQASDPDADLAERAYMQKHGLATLVVLPIVAKGQAVGVIELETWDEERRYTSEQLNLAMTLANQAAVALENARLFQETKANLEEITLLHRRYLQETWSEFLEEEKAGQGRVGYRYDHGIVSPASTVWRPEIGLAVQRGDTIALSEMADTLQGTVEEVGAILEASPEESALAVPLKVRDQVIGALDFYETDQARDWSAEDIAMVETVANQVALAIENARAYEELQKRAEQLKEMDRLKTQFLANMSHELRTPLNSIIGFSRVILKGIDGPITEQQRADLTSIHNNGQHLLAMINDILDISKIEASKMELIFEPVDMQQMISGVMSTAAALVEDKPIELKQEVASDLPIIRADSTRVRQVILNLLSNAAKFTEEGQITLRSWADEEQITISVEDTGIGVPSEHQTTIFEEFRQVDASTTRRTGGTGLGLAISRHFVEMHGGRIWVESEPDVGSTFTFTLPITGPAPIAESELADLSIDTNCKLILAVEDDEGAISIYKRYLEKRGYQVVGLNQGEQAVRWAQELAPCAIILDVLLQDKDGWTVLEELKSSRESHQIPVIICTIVDDEEARGLSLGAADYLVKPILEEDLLQSLQRLEERQRV
jgi:PAS domain S-box-containing protein